LGNVMVNTLIAQITDRFVTGAAGTALSTALITLGGEIIPQASMAAHALQVGAASVPICRLFLFLFYPICGPLAYLLDRFVGTDPGQIYDRNELRKLMTVHASSHFTKESGLVEQDLNVMLGAMDLHDKTVAEAMTPVSEVYMIEAHEILTDQMIHEIWESGHSRIPVYRGQRGNIIGLLFAKDLLLTRTDERTTVLDIIRFYPRTALSVMSDTKLIVVLQEFRTGRSHLATVKQVIVNVGGGDPVYETVGIVTMEDVVEELIRANIEDEFDVRENDENNNNNKSGSDALQMTPSRAFQIKRSKDRATGGNLLSPLEQKWLGLTKECIRAMRKTTLEESHARVASLFLVESVAPFRDKEPSLVRSLFIHRDHVFRIKAPLRARQLTWESRGNMWLFRKGVPTNFMVLVIAGSVEVFMDEPSTSTSSPSSNNNNNMNNSSGDFYNITANDYDDQEMEEMSSPRNKNNRLNHSGASMAHTLLPSFALPIMEMGQWTVLGASVIGTPTGTVVPDFSARVVSNSVLCFINAQQFKDSFSHHHHHHHHSHQHHHSSFTTTNTSVGNNNSSRPGTPTPTTTNNSNNNNGSRFSPLTHQRVSPSRNRKTQQQQQRQNDDDDQDHPAPVQRQSTGSNVLSNEYDQN
jgi:Mg2+/Co2+ transporter CorC